MQGLVRGFIALNGTVDVFFGIPFATPPVGELRFEKPLPPLPYNGTLDAVDYPPVCIQYLQNDCGVQNCSEDCLYLNIFAPHRENPLINHSLYPVVVLIHGGGFQLGSMHENYGNPTQERYTNFTDLGLTFVQHGIVMVGIQYRLGVLGFASTGDSELPGNLGLHDQTAALVWLRENIAHFGGNPNDIVLFGQSAGSASVSSLTLSPLSRNLFHRAVQMSGSAVSSWVYGYEVTHNTLRLAQTLGCPDASSIEIKNCLKGQSVSDIQAALAKMGPARPQPNSALFQPRFDREFFPKVPPQLIKEAPPKPTLIGFTKLERIAIAQSTIPAPGQQIPPYTSDDLQQYIRSYIANEDRFGANASRVAQQIYAFYNSSNQEAARNANTFYLHQFAQLNSDLLFAVPPFVEVRLKTEQGWPVFMYHSNYANDASFPDYIPIHEAYHGYDLELIFHSTQIPYSEQDLRIVAFMQETMRNFFKTGNPSTFASTPIQWPRVEPTGQYEHVEIVAPEPVVRPNMVEEVRHLEFYRELVKQYPEYDVMYELPQNSTVKGGFAFLQE